MTTSAPIATVASSSSAAAAGGSVIDVQSLVSQLVTATRAPQDSLIAAKTDTVTTQISAVGTLKGALSSFQSALSSLATPAAYNVETANSSNESVFTATAGPTAVGGTYNVDVTQLASAQQLVSKPFPFGGSQQVGNGTLQVSMGGTSFDVTIGDDNNTVAGIAAAINSAKGNPGVTATVITGTDGAHLVLSSSLTGAANTLQVTETDSSGALASLTYDGTNDTSHYTEKEPAQDAEFSISGIPHTSPTNTVSNALDGVTLTLTGTSAADDSGGNGDTLTVASDTGTIQANIANFVSAYNSLVGTFTTLGSYDSTSGTAGSMLGDPLLTGIQNQIRSALYSVVNTGSSTYNSLASVGITTNKDGTLTLDNATLSTAMAAAPGAVSALFSSTNGVAANLNTQITTDLAKNGSIDSRSTTLVEQDTDLSDQTTKLNTAMAALTASLTQQYATLNTLLSSLQTTSAYLTQQFAALPKVQNGN